MDPEPTTDRRSPARSFARVVVRIRVLIVLAWAGLAVLAVFVLPPLRTGGGAGLRGLVPSDSAALQAEIDSFQAFGFPMLSRTMVVQRDSAGLSGFAQARAVLRAASLARGAYPGLRRIAGGLPLINRPGIFEGAGERDTTVVTYLFFDQT